MSKGGDGQQPAAEPAVAGTRIVIYIVVALVLFTVGGVVALFLTGGDPSSHTLNGELELLPGAHDPSVDDRNACVGAGDYQDIRAGTQVTVSDNEGATTAHGSLSRGRLVDAPGGAVCTLTFIIEGVPDSSFYGVEVSDRGVVRYSADQLEQNDWEIRLNLAARS